MSHIYYIWKDQETYIGLDSGTGYGRIQDHIKSLITNSTDGARNLIKTYGITNVSYGVFPQGGSSISWGLPANVLTEFKKVWIPGDDLQLAEILHIIWAKTWGVTLHNTTIGGQLKGNTVYYVNDKSLTIHLRDRLDDWERVRKKILYPEIYGLLRKVCNEVLVKEYRKPSFWLDTLKYILNNPNAPYSTIVDDLEQTTTKSLLSEIGRILGPRIQKQYEHQIKQGVYLPLSSMVKEYYFWVKQHVNPNIHKTVEDIVNEIYTGWQGKRKKGNSNSRVKRMVFTFNPSELYAEFKEPNTYPLWYQLLINTPHTVKPQIWSGNDAQLQLAIKQAAFYVFEYVVDEARKKWGQTTNFILKPDESGYLKTRVALEYEQLGINVSANFWDWNASYRNLISLWMRIHGRSLQEQQPRIGRFVRAYSDLVANTGVTTPAWFYTFLPQTWNIIQNTTSFNDVPYNLF